MNPDIGRRWSDLSSLAGLLLVSVLLLLIVSVSRRLSRSSDIGVSLLVRLGGGRSCSVSVFAFFSHLEFALLLLLLFLAFTPTWHFYVLLFLFVLLFANAPTWPSGCWLLHQRTHSQQAGQAWQSSRSGSTSLPLPAFSSPESRYELYQTLLLKLASQKSGERIRLD